MSSEKNKLFAIKFADRFSGTKRLNLFFLNSEEELFSIGAVQEAAGKLVINLSLRMTKGRGMNSSLHLKNPSSIGSLDGASGRD